MMLPDHRMDVRTRSGRRLVAVAVALSIAASIASTALLANEAASPPRYQMPPDSIAALIDAPLTPGVRVSPDSRWLLILGQPSLPPIEEVAQPELRLAGLRINPSTNGPSRQSYFTDLRIQDLTGGEQRLVNGLPAAARIRDVSWSPDSAHVAFSLTVAEGLELWVADRTTAQARRLLGPRLNAANGNPCEWFSDSENLVCRLIPPQRPAPPAPPAAPPGPVTQESLGRKAPARTYQDLLQNAHDEALFDHYLTCEVAQVSLQGQIQTLAQPAIYSRIEPSPDGSHVLVEQIRRPYSYLVPVSRFPLRVEVWDRQGRMQVLAELPLADEVPVTFGAVRPGRRSFGWRDDSGATLFWAEAGDGGDPRATAEIRDRVFMLPAPFNGQPAELIQLSLRFESLAWSSGRLALATEWWWQNRRRRTWIIRPDEPGTAPELLFDRTWEDRYNDPGSPAFMTGRFGRRVLLSTAQGAGLLLLGSGASPEGDRPFVDELNLATRQVTRLWRSQAPVYETTVQVLGQNPLQILTRREAVDEPPNYFIRDLPGADARPVTSFPHPAPQLRGVYKEMIRYRRADGVDLTGTLYLPPGRKPEDGPFPVLMWAYPQEFKSADAAGQVTDSPHRFVQVAPLSPLLWLALGYAVLDNPSLPIVGEGQTEPNDTYIAQLVAGAQAAVDELVRRGVADPQRIAIGGHSYGAFMTANLLAHSNLFRAGIARSGAYNRTLTPFSFQSEERTLWEAPHVYVDMSPFMHADRIDEPILLIHGLADNNAGTFPIQSERFFNAIQGLGGTARLVMLPDESHGYRARESVMHTAWEMTSWLEKYVKNAEPRQDRSKSGDVDPKAGPASSPSSPSGR